jgi:hypothetical protein
MEEGTPTMRGNHSPNKCQVTTRNTTVVRITRHGWYIPHHHALFVLQEKRLMQLKLCRLYWMVLSLMSETLGFSLA